VPGAGTSGIPGVKLPDFSQFGEVEREGMSRMMSVTALNMHRSWLNVPHVTQFEDADISDMEDFRKSLKALGEKKGVKMTPLPFMLKACAAALAELPQFNVALDMERKEVVHKKYIHIGIAVDTPHGLMVPVIRNVDQKNLWELAAESAELAGKARDKKLKPAEMQGACFTITSLGGIGGTAFTPIVNTPEVAILGVSKAAMKPVWDGKAFQPRLMLPLSLSYDHRAVNGADAARFTSALARLMGDIRTLLL
jgi:pyruvate dehydrogenase E2 component (dihydrolipoamide acetyltransferase)